MSTLLRMRGLGAASPEPDVTGETTEDCQRALQRDQLGWIVGWELALKSPFCRELYRRMPSTPAARAALDIAFHDLYAQDLGLPLAYGMGVLQTALAIAIIVGFKTNISYLIGFVIHGLSTLSTIGRLIDPYGPGNHLFMTAVPVLAGMWLLYVMRDADVKLSVDAMRRTASD